jgi:hypothetical protein
MNTPIGAIEYGMEPTVLATNEVGWEERSGWKTRWKLELLETLKICILPFEVMVHPILQDLVSPRYCLSWCPFLERLYQTRTDIHIDPILNIIHAHVGAN